MNRQLRVRDESQSFEALEPNSYRVEDGERSVKDAAGRKCRTSPSRRVKQESVRSLDKSPAMLHPVQARERRLPNRCSHPATIPPMC